MLTLLLVAAVPPFLAMPPWADATLYDVAALNSRHGGVHYRDVFDTNTPGFVWCVRAVRSILGESYELFRAVDFATVATTCALLVLVMHRWGVKSSNALGFCIAVALFYPFQTEFCHLQRDVWMLLPAVAALAIRTGSEDVKLRRSLVEGVLWGCAVWIKPHAIVPAAALWLATVRREGWLRDAAGQFSGGLAVGAAGFANLWFSGSWPWFLDIAQNWNPEYAAATWKELDDRWPWKSNLFGVWDLLHFAAVPLALLNLWNGPQSRRGLAALYLGWAAQALFLQKGFPYVHIPEVILGLAVLAGHCWPVGWIAIGWFVAIGVLQCSSAFNAEAQKNVYLKSDHPLLHRSYYDDWVDSLKEGSSPELRDRLGQFNTAHCGTEWVPLERVAAYLRLANLKDGELLCWHDGTHPLYRMLGVKPALRYMHWGTAWAFEKHRREIVAEVEATTARYVVADLRFLSSETDEANAPGDSGKWDRLPAWVPDDQRSLFPWTQQIVFRSDRYVVFEIARPLGRIHLDSQGEVDARRMATPK